MLSEKEKSQIRAVLEEQQKRLAGKSQNALTYSMNHERNIGRDSIDESMEEEIFSTEMRLHDREKFLLGKVTKQLSFRRLLARPVTTLCIDCKEQSEREEAAAEQSGRGSMADLGDLGDGEGKSPGGLED